MHIADGILPAGPCLAAQAAAVGVLWWSGRALPAAQIPRVGLLSAGLFVVSLLHFPVAGTAMHLGLYGFAGILLGRRGFLALYAALFLQAVLFQHGGLMSLGVNALNMGLGIGAGVVLWRIPVLPEAPRAFLAGCLGTLLPVVLMAAEFAATGYGKGFWAVASVYALVALLEGAATVLLVQVLRRSSPQLLPA
jgi:cobalt/nickel transport system permease protein